MAYGSVHVFKYKEERERREEKRNGEEMKGKRGQIKGSYT